jgi:hypothetical protein
MSKLNSSMVFLLLICVFLASILFGSYQTDIVWISIFFITLSISVAISTTKILLSQAFGAQWKEYPKPVLAIVIGAIATFYLAKSGMSAVLASSLVGIAGSLLFKRYEIEVFTGSFVGMSSIILFTDVGVVLAALIASLVYLMGKNVFVGIGGKLGTSAFAGTLSVALLLNVDVYTLDIAYINTTLPFWFVLATLVASALASMLTNQLAQRWFKGSTVLGSSFIGILGYLLSLVLGAYSGLFAGTIFAASFAGMSQNKVLKSPQYFMIAGAITAILFLASSTFFLGLGGKMGTSAFIGVIATLVLIKKTK